MFFILLLRFPNKKQIQIQIPVHSHSLGFIVRLKSALDSLAFDHVLSERIYKVSLNGVHSSLSRTVSSLAPMCVH